jgi:hypothetical protein
MPFTLTVRTVLIAAIALALALAAALTSSVARNGHASVTAGNPTQGGAQSAGLWHAD